MVAKKARKSQSDSAQADTDQAVDSRGGAEQPPLKWRRLTGKKAPTNSAWANTLGKKERNARDALLQRFAMKLPKAPAAAKSPYNLFYSKVYKEATAGGEKVKMTDMLSKIGKRWEALPAREKKEYEKAAVKDKERLHGDLKAFMETASFSTLRLDVDRFLRMNSARRTVGEKEVPLQDWWAECRAKMRPQKQPKSPKMSTGGRASDAKSVGGKATPDGEASAPVDKEAEKQKKKAAREREVLIKRVLSIGKKDGGTPKQNMGPYAHWFQDIKDEEKANGGEFAVMMKRCAARWSAMDAAAKAPYIQKAKEDKERYDKELKAFREGDAYKEIAETVEEFQKEQEAAKAEPSEEGKAKSLPKLGPWLRTRQSKLRKRNTLLSGILSRAPKKCSLKISPSPPSAFMIFATEKRPEVAAEGGSMAEISKRLGERWTSLSAEDKKPYLESALAKKTEHDAAMKTFRLSEEYKSFCADVDHWQLEGKKPVFWVWRAKREKAKALREKKEAATQAKQDRVAAKAAAKAEAKAAAATRKAELQLARVQAKAAEKAAARAAKAGLKAVSGGAAGGDVPMALQPLEEDPFWDALPQLDEEDMVLNDKIVVACARKGGVAALEILSEAARRADRAVSLFRRRSAGCPETALHYALVRKDRDMLRILERDTRRGSSCPRATGLEQPGTTLWLDQPGHILQNLKLHEGPSGSAKEVQDTLTMGMQVEVEEINGEWFKLKGLGWMARSWCGNHLFATEDPDNRRPRTPAKQPELAPVSTGFASGRAYRAKKLRKVKLSRGGREGNQAFVRDVIGNYQSPPPDIDEAMRWAAARGVDLATLMAFHELFRNRSQLEPAAVMGTAARFGQASLTRELTEKYSVNDLWGLNALHKVALKEGCTEEEVTDAGKRKASILKKAMENFEVTPLHLACIGPDLRMVESMLGPLGSSAEDQAKDSEQRTLLHYAAAAETSTVLEMLLERKFSPHRSAADGITPLMCACMANRPHNVQKLLQAGADPLIRADEKTAFHWAVQHGSTEALSALLEHAASKGPPAKGKGQQWEQAMSSSKMNILHVACELGEEAIVDKLLTSAPKSLNRADKQGRSPLTYAVMNGHTKLASKLLSRGAQVDQADTSGNRPLHYALAYGWRNSAKLLVDWGHEPDVQNTWKNTPIDAAILKAQHSTAAWFASNYPIDPDTKDENGRTLVTKACSHLLDAQWRSVLRAVVEVRSADVNLPDGSGSLPLCLAVQQCAQNSILPQEVEACLRLLCASKADASQKSAAGPMKDQSALSIALRGQNHGLLCAMLKSGAGVAVHGRGETLLHTIPERILTSNHEGFVTSSVLNAIKEAVPQDVLKEMVQTPDKRGVLPLHATVIRMNTVMEELRGKWSTYHQQMQRVKNSGSGFGFGSSHPTKPKAGMQVVDNFRDLVRWLKDVALADLSAVVAELAEPWKEKEFATPAGAYGPVPGKLEDVVDATVLAHNREAWLKHDTTLGQASPLLMLVAGGGVEAVGWYMDQLSEVGHLEKCLSTPNIYGTTPLLVALCHLGRNTGLPADVVRRMAVPGAASQRSFNGRVPLHLAAIGCSIGWAGPLAPQVHLEDAPELTAPAPQAPAPAASPPSLFGVQPGFGGNSQVPQFAFSMPATAPTFPSLFGGGPPMFGSPSPAPMPVGFPPPGSGGPRAAHWKSKLVEIWAKHQPENVAKADEILARHPGRELSVYMKVCRKFGIRPDTRGGPTGPIQGLPPVVPSTSALPMGAHAVPLDDPRPDVFEAVLEASMTAGCADSADAAGTRPLHSALKSGFKELPEFEELGREAGSFAAAVLERAARVAQKLPGVRDDGLHVLRDLEQETPVALPHCRASFGKWGFLLEDVNLTDGKVGLGDARALAGDSAGIHWLPVKTSLGGRVAVTLDLDAKEAWVSADGHRPTDALTGIDFQDYLYPLVVGTGSCSVRLRAGAAASGASSLQEIAPPVASSQRLVSALLAARADAGSDACGDDLTALHIAASQGDAPVVLKLCEAAADPNVLSKSSVCTPLHTAMKHMGVGVTAVANALISARADVSMPSPLAVSGHVELHCYAQRATFDCLPLHFAVESGGAALVHLLVAAKADVDAPLEVKAASRAGTRWLPLCYTAEEPADPGSQEDRGLKVGSDVALEIHAAEQALIPLGTDLKKLEKAVANANKPKDVVLGDGVGVLRGSISAILGDDTYELQCGDFAHLLARENAKPATLVVPRSALRVQLQVETVSRSLVRPLHRSAERNDGEAVKALLRGGASPSVRDGFHGRLPLHSMVSHQNFEGVQALIEARSELDTPDTTEERARPIMAAVVAAIHSNGMRVMRQLLSAKAATDCPCSSAGLAPLHVAAAARHGETIDLLLSHRADPNVRDLAQRTPLHKAINAAAPSEPSFDIERRLLTAGAVVNAVDKRQRTALHYAFTKEGKPSETSFADPVETVTSLCAVEGVSVDIADEFGVTPILYAATRGATISSLYLAKRGGSLHSRDVYQNDLLGRALAASHHEYAITLLSQNAGDVNAPMRHITFNDAEESLHFFRPFAGTVVDSDRAVLPRSTSATVDLLLSGGYCAEWTLELLPGAHEAACLGLTAMPPAGHDVGPVSGAGWVCVAAGSGQLLVDGSPVGEVLGALAPGDKLSFLVDLGKGNLTVWKNAEAPQRIISERPQVFVHRLWRPAVQNNGGDGPVHVRLCGCRLLPQGVEEAQQEQRGGRGIGSPVSLFHDAIRNHWLGLAYLLLDHGFPFHKAIQDSLSLGEFRLVLTLLSKINPAQNELVRGLDETGRTLLHVLADFPGKLGPETPEIWRELAQRGVKQAHVDKAGRLALHSAVSNGHIEFARWLHSVIGNDPCCRKSDAGFYPLHGACSRAWLAARSDSELMSFINLLLKGNKAAAIEAFPDNSVNLAMLPKGMKPPVQSLPLVNAVSAGYATSAASLLDASADANARDGLNETPLGAALQAGGRGNTLKIVELLVFHGADANLPDRHGNMPLRGAIRKNDLNLVERLIKSGGNITNAPGKEPPGSFLLDAMLVTAGFRETEKEPIPPIVAVLLSLKALPNQGADTQGRSALLLAVDSHRAGVFDALLRFGAAPTSTDERGRSVLTAAIQARNKKMVLALLVAKADPQVGQAKDGKRPLFSAVEWGNQEVVEALLAAGAEANNAGVDEMGRGPLSFAVRGNHTDLAQALLGASADPRAVDRDGRNAVHHCVQPLPYGSFENAELLSDLLGATGGQEAVKMPDKEGKEAWQLAAAQGSGKLLQVLGMQSAKPTSLSAFSMVAAPEGPLPEIEKHAVAELEQIEAKAEPIPTPVHKAYGMAGDNKVMEKDGVEHDAMLFKVDLKRNEMRFYHLAIVHEVNKDLYVLFTRWGEIGETGMYQRTPQPSLEEAEKEFGKVFKEKTGNLWATKDTNFERKPNKYQILRRRKAVTRQDQMLRPFKADLDRCTLPGNLQRTVRAMCNPEMVAQALAEMGIKTETMPFGSLTRATLNEAREVLGTIRTANEELRTLESTGDRSDILEFGKKRNDIRERILELSSRYYELVPRKAGSCEVARPLESEGELSREFEALIDLAEASVAVQLLLGAQHCRESDHPFDYCFRGLGIALEEVDKSSEEFALLTRYMQGTCTNGQQPQVAEPTDFVKVVVEEEGDKDPKDEEEKRAAPKQRKRPPRPHDTITAIYRLARNSESAAFEKSGSEELKNRRLLWHGTRLSNMIGIMSQGLRIAPPEAPVSGYMFGKGVYFADCFSKSRGYCRSGSTNEPAYMMLCDVALGDMHPCKSAKYMEAPQDCTNSTWGEGRTAPDWANEIVEPGGAALPQPNMLDMTNGEQDHGYRLNYNEFIVYSTSQIRMRYLIELNNFEVPVKADASASAKRAKIS